MTEKLRKLVYAKYNEHCAYCGSKIEYKDMQVDHLYPKILHKDNNITSDVNRIENLMPTCRLCNHYKRAEVLDIYRNMLFTLTERLQKIYIVRVALRYGIITFHTWDKQFYFEKQQEE